MNSEQPKSRRGFAAMSPERQRELASKGGRAAHEKGSAHRWTAEEAREAGRKGGNSRHKSRQVMTTIGYLDISPVAEPWSDRLPLRR